MEHKVLIIVPHYWGKGSTIAEAWNRVKRESCKTLRELKRGKFRIYSVIDTDEVKTHVNNLGSICYPTDHEPRLIEEG